MMLEGETFDCAFAMEVLEHIPPLLLHPYLEALAWATRSFLLITVPNEIGSVFLAKYLIKRFIYGGSKDFKTLDLVYSTLGLSGRVARNEHKGFDYRWLCRQLDRYFEVVELSGHPLSLLGPRFNFGVGIVARPRQRPLSVDYPLQ